MPAAPASSADLLDLLKKSGLLSPERFAGLSDLSLPDDPKRAAETLVAQGYITKFQAQQFLAGRHKGFRIGPYAILDLLGRGGMGAVYLGEHLELHRKVAIKVLLPGKGDDQKLAVERFLREARSAAALDHPNIVHIFDVSRYGEVPYLVMEYVTGETLQQILDRDGAVPYTTAAEYVAQAAAGLQHAHEKGFVHRDIKPGNLIRDRSGVIKILDMGLARSSSAADKLTAQLDADAIVGTADFIAPEQAMNQSEVDGRADIYSLGATFYALIIGKPPFDGNTAQKLLQHQLKNAPAVAALDATVPKGLSAVVARMLAKKPDARYQTPAEVIAALTPWMGNSARILAGLSRTNIGQGADLHATLAEIGRAGSSRRLNPRGVPVPDSGEVDPSEAARDTDGVAMAATTRQPGRRRKPGAAPAAKAGRKPVLLYAIIGGAVLAAGGVAGWLALGPKKEPDRQTQNPPDRSEGDGNQDPKPGPKPGPKPDPKRDPVGGPKVDPPKEVSAYRFDPAKLDPFRVKLRGGNVADGKRGTLPTGVAIYALKPDTEATFVVEPGGDAPALTITRHSTIPGSQVAFELEKEAAAQGVGVKLKPDAEYKLKVRYRTGPAAQVGVSVRTLGFKPIPGGYKVFPATGDQWKTAELTFRRGADPLGMAIEALGPPDIPVSIGPVELFELVPAGGNPAAAGDERILYRLDLAAQKPFAIRATCQLDPADPKNRKGKTGKVLSKSGDGDLPAGWRVRPVDPNTEIDALADDARGGMALGIRRVSGPSAGMFFLPQFNCPGGKCRLRFDYATVGTPGGFQLRFKPEVPVDRDAWTVTNLAGTGERWTPVDREIDLRGATGGNFEFHNAGKVGDEFWVRAVEILAAGPAEAAKPFAPLPLDGLALARSEDVLGDKNRLAFADWGPKEFNGVPFYLIDPGTADGGKNVIALFSSNQPRTAALPRSVTLPVGLPAAAVHVLGGVSGWGWPVKKGASGVGAAEGTPSVVVRVRYADGEAEEHVWKNGGHLVDYNCAFGRTDAPGSEFAFELLHKRQARYLAVRPKRDAVVKEVEFAKAGEDEFTCPIIFAVTVERRGGPVPRPNPAPPADPHAAWAEGDTVYTLDVTTIPEFRVQKEHSTRLSGDPEQLPAGVGCQCSREKAVGDFRCEKADGVPALTVTNLNDQKAGQFYFQLEGALKVPLRPGKAYRVKVDYTTKNDAAGIAVVQVTPGDKTVASAALANTQGKWKTASVNFLRPPAGDKVEVRLTINNTTVGEGNALCVRAVEVVELVPPEKK